MYILGLVGFLLKYIQYDDLLFRGGVVHATTLQVGLERGGISCSGFVLLRYDKSVEQDFDTT